MRLISTAAIGAALTVTSVLAGAGTALADPGGNSATAHLRNQIRQDTGVSGRIEVGSPSDGLLGAPAGSYGLTSSTYKMGPFGDSSQVTAMCATGYYVDYTLKTVTLPAGGDVYQEYLNLQVNSGSTFVKTAFGYPNPIQPLGAKYQYQGFTMKLSNDNPFSSESGSFSWTCDPV